MKRTFTLRIYYEDTDVSGLVYHANYLRYFERAREHVLGPDELVRLLKEDGVGFVVYKCAMTFKEGAQLGDVVEVRTEVKVESPYRLIFDQCVWRPGESKQAMVEGEVHLVCVKDGALVPVPSSLMQILAGGRQ